MVKARRTKRTDDRILTCLTSDLGQWVRDQAAKEMLKPSAWIRRLLDRERQAEQKVEA